MAINLFRAILTRITLIAGMLVISTQSIAQNPYLDFTKRWDPIYTEFSRFRSSGNFDAALVKTRELLQLSAFAPTDYTPPAHRPPFFELMARTGMLLVLDDLKRHQEVVEEANKAIPIAYSYHHEKSFLQQFLGFRTQSLIALGRYDEATQSLNELTKSGAPWALSIAGKLANAKNAVALRQQQDNNVSSQALEKGQAAVNAGRYSEALDIYVSAMTTLAPRFVPILAEKAIAASQKRQLQPPVPEDARRRAVYGQTALKEAKTPDDFKRAQEHYVAAIALAPWIADLYINLGLILEQQQRYEDAHAAFTLYLKAAPDARDSETIRNKMYELEYRLEQLGRKK